jgi:hypothetical protein
MNDGPAKSIWLQLFRKSDMNAACVGSSTTEVGSPYSVAQISLSPSPLATIT